MKESRIEGRLKKAVIKEIGGQCIKFPPLFFRGFPDRIVLVPGGVIVFVETKAPDGRVTPTQGKVHGMLRKLGFRVVVLNSLKAVDDFILTL